MSEWSTIKLGDVLEITNGYAFKSVNFRSAPETGCLPVLKIKNVANGDVHINDVQYHLFEEKLSKYTAQKGDILISLTGNHPHAETQVVGAVSKLKMDIRAFVNQRVAKIDTKPNLADKDYIYFALKEEGLSKYLASQSSGSANQANISKADIEYLDVALPPLPEQKAIASVLSSLDDKIDLLHRQNKTLEAMAETLFRQWFIEEAKEDWEEKTIGDIFTIKGGGTPSTKEPSYWDGGIAWTSPRDLSTAKSLYMFSTERTITELGLTKVSSGLLPVGTLLMSSRAPIGYLALTDIEVAVNQGYIAILKHDLYSNEFMYLWCKANMELIKNSGNGSVFQEISKASFRELPFVCPPEPLLKEFNDRCINWFSKIKLNTKQIQTLENLRDTLLPKLMSGEVRVQYQTEEVA